MKIEYPKYLYHRTEKPVIVENPDEQAELGSDWKETPFGSETAPAAEAAPAATAAEAEESVEGETPDAAVPAEAVPAAAKPARQRKPKAE